MITRAVAVWLLLLVLAILNGGVREAWISPHLGEPVGHLLSTVMLCSLIALLTWLTIGWIRPVRTAEALGIGILWLLLTVTFEFVVGHYVFGQSWARLAADYNVLRGRLWPAVLVVCLLAPPWAARRQGLLMGARA
jgi:hypothetical protein